MSVYLAGRDAFNRHVHQAKNGTYWNNLDEELFKTERVPRIEPRVLASEYSLDHRDIIVGDDLIRRSVRQQARRMVDGLRRLYEEHRRQFA